MAPQSSMTGAKPPSRSLSDLATRNLFIIPTIVFLIVFNIFPLLYSLGYSFTDFRASSNDPANFVGLDNYRTLLADPNIWRNFTITAKYVVLSVTGQVVVGFGIAMLLNREIPFKGLLTTLLMLPMMLSMAVVGLFFGNCFTIPILASSTTFSALAPSNGWPIQKWRFMRLLSPIYGCGRRL